MKTRQPALAFLYASDMENTGVEGDGDEDEGRSGCVARSIHAGSGVIGGVIGRIVVGCLVYCLRLKINCLRLKINIILGLNMQTNIKYKIIKILFVFYGE